MFFYSSTQTPSTPPQDTPAQPSDQTQDNHTEATQREATQPSPQAQATFAETLNSFATAEGLPFADVLPEDKIEAIAAEEGMVFASGADCVYTPAVTLLAFLTQILSPCKSCVAAVARVLVLRVALGLPPCSAATGGYCKARAKLSEAFLQRLTLEVGEEVERQAPDDWRWKGRRVLLTDGTECSMPDTPENQLQYPQPDSQKPGLGFPMIRLVVLLTFATAALVGAAMGPCQGKKTGETTLFRVLLKHIQKGDVVVADRLYCSYWMVALLLEAGADVAFRLHASRKYDFRRGRRLGRKDHVVVWTRPARPEWMSAELYEQIPESLTIRETCFRVTKAGYRTREIIVATSMIDAQECSKEELADLYHQRWHIELDIRSIKQTLKMDILSCKTAEMVRKEIWTHLLVYNLVRKVMAQAALQTKRTPRRVSFAGAMQTLDAFRWVLLLSEPSRRVELVRVILIAIATHEVGNRPDRVEPRKVKRRPKSFPRLTQPREQERAECYRTRSA